MSLLKTSFKNGSSLIISYFCFFPFVQSRNITKMVDLSPPPEVRGMKKLERGLFVKSVEVPCLVVKSGSVRVLSGVLKKYFLKLRNLKPIRPVLVNENTTNETNQSMDDSREVLLDPRAVAAFSDIAAVDQAQLSKVGVDKSCLRICCLQLTYDNWTADDVLTAVLPEGVEIAAGYSLVGHIVHVNLREHLHEYKHVIGEVMLDKIKQARTVVNKIDNIDNTFRVFNMEVLAGEPDFITEVRENYLRFKFDFSAVYWNPRLSTEHERIVKKLQAGNVLYDVFAGVGPFSIPAAYKKCKVLANDLNPESFKWLQHNAKLNKVEDSISTYNKDGADFIKEEIKQHVIQHQGEKTSHVVMNLPAIAVTFLSAFKQLFSPDQFKNIKTLPFIHVYCFVKGEGDFKEMAKELVETHLNSSVSQSLDEIVFVRNVAPNKNMMRVSFQLTENIIFGSKRKLELDSNNKESKKTKQENEVLSVTGI